MIQLSALKASKIYSYDMDFEEPTVNEEEIDALGIKKKDNADVDTDLPEDDAALPVELSDEEEEKDGEKGIFGDDPELEEYMLAGYDEK